MISLISCILIISCVLGMFRFLSYDCESYSEAFVKVTACGVGLYAGLSNQFGYNYWWLIVSFVILVIIVLLVIKWGKIVRKLLERYRVELYRLVAILIVVACLLDRLRV